MSKDLVVHYIDFNNSNENPSNGITLCKKCHAYFHGQFHVEKEIEEKLQSNAGRKNKITCKYCGKEFKVPPSGKDQKYCSQNCAIKAKKELTDKRALRMYKDIQNGMRVRDIAEKYSVSTQTVRRLVNKRAPRAFNKPQLDLRKKHLNKIRDKAISVKKEKAKKKSEKAKN